MLLNWLSRLFMNIIGNIYPSYATYKAVLGNDPSQHKQWLTYWIVYSMFSLFEIVGDSLVSWLPLYWEAKTIFIIYLVCGGASVVYNSVLVIFLKRYEDAIDEQVTRGLSTIQSVAAEKVNEAAKHGKEKGFQLLSEGMSFLSSLHSNPNNLLQGSESSTVVPPARRPIGSQK